jgi:hypothetical protein
MTMRLSALHAGRPLQPRKIPGTHFCQRQSRPQGHSAVRKIMPTEKSNALIGNRTRDLPACNIVPRYVLSSWLLFNEITWANISPRGSQSVLFDITSCTSTTFLSTQQLSVRTRRNMARRSGAVVKANDTCSNYHACIQSKLWHELRTVDHNSHFGASPATRIESDDWRVKLLVVHYLQNKGKAHKIFITYIAER